MNTYNKRDENKEKGFIPFLSRLFGVGVKSASSLGSTGSSIFATKAGLVGMVLGGATIAAGIGVIYNFIGPSSNKVYTPGLFQQSYYEEQAQKANTERVVNKNASVSTPSTLDMFKEQANKEGISNDEFTNDQNSSNGSEASASSDVNVPEVTNVQQESQSGGPSGGGKLQASLGLGSKSGGVGSSVSAPRLQTSGGLFGGIGQEFKPVYRPSPNQANSGMASGMKGALASKIGNSPRYAIPNINRKGALTQAKAAKISGLKSQYIASPTGMKSQAGLNFDYTTPAKGDIGTPSGGAGIGGSGVMDGAQLKANNPNLNTNEIQPPTPKQKTPDNPWQKLQDYAVYAMLTATALILLTKILVIQRLFAIARITAYLAMAAAGIVILAGLGLMTGKNIFGGKNFDPQKLVGAMYLLAGGMLMWQAYEALCGVDSSEEKYNKFKADYIELFGGGEEGEAAFKAWEESNSSSEIWDAVNKHNNGTPIDKIVEIPDEE